MGDWLYSAIIKTKACSWGPDLICNYDKCKSLVGKFRQFSDKLQSWNLCFTFHRLLGLAYMPLNNLIEKTFFRNCSWANTHLGAENITARSISISKLLKKHFDKKLNYWQKLLNFSATQSIKRLIYCHHIWRITRFMFNCFSKLAVTLFKQFGLKCKILSSLKTWKISPTIVEKAKLSKMTCSKKSF